MTIQIAVGKAKSNRTKRIAELIKREVAGVLLREFRDLKLLATISGVEVSRDFSHATIFVTFLDSELEEGITSGLRALRAASGRLRYMIGKNLSLRVTPALSFRYDPSVASGAHLSGLLAQAAGTAPQG